MAAAVAIAASSRVTTAAAVSFAEVMSSADMLLFKVAASSTAPAPAASASAVTRVFADAVAEAAAVAI